MKSTELLEKYIDKGYEQFDLTSEIEDYLQEILQAHKKEIAEKDKEIKYYKDIFEETNDLKNGYEDKYEELKSNQLFKEDFELNCPVGVCNYSLKDNSKYDLLESKSDRNDI